MIYDEEAKNKVLVRLAKSINVKDISLELNVSTTTIYEWKKMYEIKIYFIKTSIEVRDLINQGMYNEALEICSREEFLNHEVIQSQRVTILIIQKRYKEALEICNKEEFSNNKILQSQRVNILMKQRRYKEALEICNKEEFSNDKIFKKQKTNISMLQDNYLLLLNKVKEREMAFDEIKTCDICPLEQVILIMAFYETEKYPQRTILNYLKARFLEYENDNEALNILNLLKERILQKNYFFDIEFYQYLIMKNKRKEERRELLAVKENLNEHKNKEVNNTLK